MLLHIENLKEIRKFCSIFENPPKSDKIFLDRSKKYFLKKLRKFFEHQYRSKISRRIEWKHSQSLKNTLKHSYQHWSVPTLLTVLKNPVMHEPSVSGMDVALFT